MISLHSYSRVIEIRGIALLEMIGILAGLWLVLDSLMMFVCGKFSARIYQASLVRSLYKFSLDKKPPETQILGNPRILRPDFFTTLKHAIGKNFNSRDLKIHKLTSNGQQKLNNLLDVRRVL